MSALFSILLRGKASQGVGTYEHALKGDDLGFHSVEDKVRDFFFLFFFFIFTDQ